jgi:hypothetical protein
LQSLRQFSKAWHCFVVTDKRHQNRKPHEQAHAVFKKILLSLCSNGICYPTQRFKAKDEVQEATAKNWMAAALNIQNLTCFTSPFHKQ